MVEKGNCAMAICSALMGSAAVLVSPAFRPTMRRDTKSVISGRWTNPSSVEMNVTLFTTPDAAGSDPVGVPRPGAAFHRLIQINPADCSASNAAAPRGAWVSG